MTLHLSASLVLLPGPFDHGLWRAVEEDELGVKVFLQVQLSCFSDEEDVGAEFEDAVHIGQLLEHDGMRDSAEELTHKLTDHQHHGHVQTHDAERREMQLVKSNRGFKTTHT